ncbi:MAG: aldehyde dehydrogenase family protein [Isosphaeraceae bacterium]
MATKAAAAKATAKSGPPASNGRPSVRLTKLFIDNEWCDPADGGSFETCNPATGEMIATVAAAGPGDVDRAVKAARRALETGPWSSMDAADRGRLMFKLADLVEQNADELASLESLNCGKTIADSKGDLEGVCNTLRYYAGWADKVEGRTIPVRGNFLSYTLRQPVGVIGQIIPWNFPLLMLAWKWGPALACGNAVVMKPAEQTPLTALRMAELAREAGFPGGVINILNGMGETTGAAIVNHPDVDKIAFTGHVDTAKIIQKAAADTLKRTTFELGGKSPNVIFADADMDAAVAGAFHAIYFHGGQCCTAGSRLFVESRIHEEFVERLAEKAKGRVIGDPLDARTEQGPQVSQEQLDKILHYVDLGEKQGARLITGGERVGQQGFFVQPTIFDNVTDEMTIARDEIFGPVVSVLPFKTVDEVIERANRTHYGLAAAVWTKDIDKAHLYARKVRAGTVWVNCYHVVDATTPFGGFKMSGQGRENGEAALEHYTELKTVTVKLGG